MKGREERYGGKEEGCLSIRQTKSTVVRVRSVRGEGYLGSCRLPYLPVWLFACGTCLCI